MSLTAPPRRGARREARRLGLVSKSSANQPVAMRQVTATAPPVFGVHMAKLEAAAAPGVDRDRIWWPLALAALVLAALAVVVAPAGAL